MIERGGVCELYMKYVMMYKLGNIQLLVNYASPVVVSLPGCSVGGIGVGVVAVSA